MRLWHALAALALLSSAAHAQTPPVALDLTEINRQVIASVVVIETRFEGQETGEIANAQGSGFIVNELGFVGTANHVVDETQVRMCVIQGCKVTVAARIGSRSSPPLELDLLDRKAMADAALFKIRSPPADKALRGLPVGKSNDFRPGGKLYALGAAQGFNIFAKPGTVLDPAGPKGRWVTNLPVNPGDSGGPVVDEAGRIVGIVGGGYAETSGTTYVVPLYLTTFWAYMPIPDPAPAAASSACAPVAGPVGEAVIGEWKQRRAVAAAAVAPVAGTVVARIGPDGCSGACKFKAGMAKLELPIDADLGKAGVEAELRCTAGPCAGVDLIGPVVLGDPARIVAGVRVYSAPVEVRLSLKVPENAATAPRVVASGKLRFNEPFAITIAKGDGSSVALETPYGAYDLTVDELVAETRPRWLALVEPPREAAGSITVKLALRSSSCAAGQGTK